MKCSSESLLRYLLRIKAVDIRRRRNSRRINTVKWLFKGWGSLRLPNLRREVSLFLFMRWDLVFFFAAQAVQTFGRSFVHAWKMASGSTLICVPPLSCHPHQCQMSATVWAWLRGKRWQRMKQSAFLVSKNQQVLSSLFSYDKYWATVNISNLENQYRHLVSMNDHNGSLYLRLKINNAKVFLFPCCTWSKYTSRFIVRPI